MRHCLVDVLVLDNEAECWNMTDITKIVRNKRLAMHAIHQDHSNANLDQLRSFTFHEINNQLLSMRVALCKGVTPMRLPGVLTCCCIGHGEGRERVVIH